MSARPACCSTGRELKGTALAAGPTIALWQVLSLFSAVWAKPESGYHWSHRTAAQQLSYSSCKTQDWRQVHQSQPVTLVRPGEAGSAGVSNPGKVCASGRPAEKKFLFAEALTGKLAGSAPSRTLSQVSLLPKVATQEPGCISRQAAGSHPCRITSRSSLRVRSQRQATAPDGQDAAGFTQTELAYDTKAIRIRSDAYGES